MSKIDAWIEHLKQQRTQLADFLVKGNYVSAADLEENTRNRNYFSGLRAHTLKELKMACIMDRFTLDSYKPECNLLELTPENWKDEIDAFEPELVFIESAWQGKDGLWYRKIANGSPELYQMTSYCHEKDIPVIFWNKEDPIYTDTFMPAAGCADYVFTTDIDCIQKYKESLNHDNVFFLHFAAQPAVHNPIEKFTRKDKFCFAGAYYHRYPDRAKTFDDFSKVFIDMKGLDIYDRNYNDPKPEFLFPDMYKKYILGTLDSSEIDIAYKGYNYGINMNSVEQSQTMFARRVFEMLASNTVTVGNYSRGVKNLLGDLTISTNDATTLKNDLQKYCGDWETYRKYRLQGLRSVLQNHLYEDRLNYIVTKVFGKTIMRKLPLLTLFCCPDDKDLQRVIKMFSSQTYPNKILYLVGDFEQPDEKDVVVLTNDEERQKKVADYVKEGCVGIWNPHNYYGENYLLDIALTYRYISPSGVGKGGYYSMEGDSLQSYNTESLYKYTDSLQVDRAVFDVALCDDFSIEEYLNLHILNDAKLFSIDAFNFCENCQELTCDAVDDLVVVDRGIALKKIESVAEGITGGFGDNQSISIAKEKIVECLRKKSFSDIKVEVDEQSILIESKLAEDEKKYIYFNDLLEIEKYAMDDHLNFQFAGVGDLDVMGVCVLFDAQRNKLDPLFTKLNIISKNKIPNNAKYFQLGYRIRGNGSCKIKGITLRAESMREDMSCFLSRSNVLILSNQYPSPQALYRNMFVHKRVTAYSEKGCLCDIMRMNIYAENKFREFDNINIVEGQADKLGSILSNGYIDTVCVHFLDRSMWEVLKQFGKKLRIYVWMHGAEIETWWRREYNYTTSAELEKAKEESAIRQAFWKEVFSEIDKHNIHFIFVSRQFAEEVFQDNEVELPEDRYSVIHNCIDTTMFKYIKKDPEQRKKILSVRPFASNKYGNDMTVKCIEELAKEPFFKELEFLIIGDGVLFDKITAPLKKYSNVTLQKTFLRQEEIAKLHKEYGIFITPTRKDTHGVSRDEAMSSGLIPVTNAITAIPEFVDDSCGILAPGEDYHKMAEGIKTLYFDAALFSQMSENAAARVRRQTSPIHTISKEIELIWER